MTVFLAGAPAAQTSFSDSDFNDPDWNQTHCQAGPGGSAVSGQRTDPAVGTQYMWVSHIHNSATTANKSQLATTLRRSSFRYDPRASGGIDGVDFSFSTKRFSPNPGPGSCNLGIAPALFQNNEVFVARSFFCTPEPAWTARAVGGVSEVEFVRYSPCAGSAGGAPDFSCGAPPIEFGFIVASTHTAPILAGGDAGIDDLTITVHTGVSSFTMYGTGCGPAGPLSLGVLGSAPACGSSSTFVVGNIPAGMNAMILTIGTQLLPPFSLAPLGLPACTLYVNGPTLAFAATPGTTATTLAVPSGANGVELHMQALTIDTAAPTLQLAMSPAARMIIF